MIAECKRIRTKKGDPMMFATLDDLEAQVEMLVFNSAYASNAEKVDTDRVLIVRGRVDHKEQGETKLVAQEVEPFEPTPEELASALEASAAATAEPKPVWLSVDGSVGDGFLDDLRDLVATFPGDHEIRLRIGARTLILGDGYRVASTSACHAHLAALTGVTASPS